MGFFTNGMGVYQQMIPDSGARTDFVTGAVRDAAGGKGMPAEIPPLFLRSLAKRLEDGAAKYDRGNWRKGIPLSRYYEAVQRHSWAAFEGRTDEDHFGAMAFNVMGWQWTAAEIAAGRLPAELDDLPFKIAE